METKPEKLKYDTQYAAADMAADEKHENGQRPMRSTTILSIRHKGKIVVAGDGQVSMGEVMMKGKAQKVRRLYKDQVIVGFAGATADAMTLFERLEGKLEKHGGNVTRASVELAKDWRTDRMLRRLEALVIVAGKESSFILTGAGDVIEPDEGILAIGSGGSYALAAARALVKHTDLDARSIAEESMHIASEICIYTNDQIVIEEL